MNYWRENVKDPRYQKHNHLERLLRVSQINEWGKEHKWDNLLECNYDNKPEPTRAPPVTTTTSTTKPVPPTKASSPMQSTKPVQSTTASTQASPKTTKVTTTTTTPVAASASSSCEVNLIPKDSEWYLYPFNLVIQMPKTSANYSKTYCFVYKLKHRLWSIDYGP